MILRNFGYRARQYAQDNRAKLIKSLLVAIAVVFLILLFLGGVASWKDRQYRKEIQRHEQRYLDKDAEAKTHEARADALKVEIDALEADAKELARRSDAAEVALRNARGKVVTLKEAYETVRYMPVPDAPVSVDDACAKLAGIGYPCQ